MPRYYDGYMARDRARSSGDDDQLMQILPLILENRPLKDLQALLSTLPAATNLDVADQVNKLKAAMKPYVDAKVTSNLVTAVSGSRGGSTNGLVLALLLGGI